MGPALTNDQHLKSVGTLLTLAIVMAMALAQYTVRGTCATLIRALAAHICQLHGPLGRIHFAPVLLPTRMRHHVAHLTLHFPNYT